MEAINSSQIIDVPTEASASNQPDTLNDKDQNVITTQNNTSEIVINESTNTCADNLDDELEEGELKDDDDDDDDDDLGGNLQNSKQPIDHSGDESASVDSVKSDTSKTSSRSRVSKSSKVSRKSRSNSTSSSSSSRSSSSSSRSSSSGSSNSNKSSSNNDSTTTSNSSSSSSSDGSSSSSSRASSSINNHSNDGSSGRQSLNRSQNSKSRGLSPTNQHAKLVSMRAKLLEARSREIEMKFQKSRSTITSSPSISVISSSASVLSRPSNLKTTIAKPPITYAENPNPTSPAGTPPPKVKKPKKRKKKSSHSSSKHKKRAKSADSPKKGTPSTTKDTNQPESTNDIDCQGPRTPPDNQVLSLEDEQIEWPSYLIKMTVTQPSISYSVNPASVIESTQPIPGSEMADLNSDYHWYYNYLLGMDLSKAQAHHQACSIILSTGDYDDQRLDKFLEQRGFIREPTSPKLDTDGADKSRNVNQTLQQRSVEPVVTTLRLNREIILPNGKVLPRGTIQKIVHPFPRTDRVVPDIRTPFFDL